MARRSIDPYVNFRSFVLDSRITSRWRDLLNVPACRWKPKCLSTTRVDAMRPR